jgi:hypothetical protein
LILYHLTDANSFSYWSEYVNPPPMISKWTNVWRLYVSTPVGIYHARAGVV